MMKRVQIILSLLISVVCLYYSFRNIDWGQTWTLMLGAGIWYVTASIAVSLASVWIRAWRWKFMVDPIKPVRVSGLFSSTMIGFMANNILPARLGEFVRAYAVGQEFGLSKSAAFATIVIERAFDLGTLVFCLGVALFLVRLNPAIQMMGYVAIGSCVLTFVALFWFHRRREQATRLMDGLLRRLPEKPRERANRLMHSFIDGLGVLARGGHILAILVLSLVMWGSVAWSMDLCMRALSLVVPWYASIVMLVVVSLGLMIPSGPGFAGTFEAATILSLLIFPGVIKEQAVSFAILFHVTQFVPVTVIGLYYFWKSNLSLRGGTSDER
jgi:glycosyltransferase 2 family protein